MIKECDICVFYYNKNYMPPKRKSCNRAVSYYIPKSGTALAYDFAVRVSGGHLCEAEAPTEPAGETAVRCAAIRFSLFKGEADSFALRTQNDKPVTYFRFHFCNVRYSASIFCFYANGLLYRCKRCLCF